jgi:hypothetical protein
MGSSKEDIKSSQSIQDSEFQYQMSISSSREFRIKFQLFRYSDIQYNSVYLLWQ